MKTLLLISTFLILSLIGCTTTTKPTSPTSEPPTSIDIPVVKPPLTDDGLITLSYAPKKGQSGGNIELIQEALNARGASLKVDGSFGSGTEAAIKAFQKSNGLTPDGILGEKTLKALGFKVGPFRLSSGVPVLSWESNKSPERNSWSRTIAKYVDEQFNNLDAAAVLPEFCPNYANLTPEEKQFFWSELIVAMLKRESNWNPRTSYFETDKSLRIYSLGFFQLSYEDNKRYNFCTFDRATESLFVPELNLQCGIRIMGYWTNRDKIMTAGTSTSTAKGLARY